jgi:adenosylhomocysteine nucleosidase
MIAVSFALPEESKGVVRALKGARRSGPAALPIVAGRLDGREVVIVHTGMGMASATARVGCFLEAHGPTHWIASGFGGGLSPELGIGDIIAVQNFSDGELFRAVAALPARAGTLITTKDVVETAEKKKDLARHTGAIVVDMETAAISRLCEARGIPMLAIRAISDRADQDLPIPAAVWFDMRKQKPRVISLVLHLALHPGRAVAFAGFVRGINRARGRLTPFLIEAIAALPEG